MEDAAPGDDASRGGSALSLFSVTISGPGGLRWSVIVRTSDPETAAAMVRARGHDVVKASPWVRSAQSPALPESSCPVCGYSLIGLPPDPETKLHLCPECGTLNLPQSPSQALVSTLGNRRRIGRWIALAIIGLLILLIVLLLR